MDGSYLSGKQRAKLIQQSRKSHLILGKTDGQFITTQKLCLKPYAENNSSHNYSHKRTSSHVILGSDPNLMSTEFGANFRMQSNSVEKSKPKINYSNKSNVVMGKQNMSFIPSSTKYKSLKYLQCNLTIIHHQRTEITIFTLGLILLKRRVSCKASMVHYKLSLLKK